MSLKKGEKAPLFTLKNQDGIEINLQSLLVNGPVVLFFYPKAFTKVCTDEACSFGRQFEKFTALNATVLGISTDNVGTLKRFQKEYDLPYDLLSDQEKKVSKKYGAYVPILGISSRVTYVLGQDGLIKAVHSGMMQSEPHIRQSLKELEAI